MLRKDRIRREQLYKYEVRRNFLKRIIYDQEASTSFVQRFRAHLELAQLPRDSSKVRIRNRCLLTGRGKSVYRTFKISRIKLRELGLNGFIPGLKKSSW